MAKDPRVESLLKRENYKFLYHEKEMFTDIDLKASEENPARINRKINLLTVNQYGCSMLDGAVFPAIVLLRRDRDKHLVATGMHRIKAAIDVGRDCFDAYIVTEADQYRFDVLIRLLNSVEGQGDTQKEQLKHVISLHEIYNRDSLPQLAKMFHLNENTVLNAWNEHLGIQRLSRLGFDFEGKQPQNTIIALGRIPTDLVLMKAAEFVAHYDVTGRDTEDLVKQLKGVRAKGESAEIEVIQKHHDKAEETRRKNKSRTRKTGATACTRFFGTVRSINRKVQGGIEHLYLTALPDVDDAITVAEDNIEHMTKIKEELYRIKRLHAASHGGSGMPIAAAPHI